MRLLPCRFVRTVACFAPISLTFAFAPAPANAQHYAITDLGTLGGNNSVAYGINDHGDTVGSADLPALNVQHAFLYRSSNGTMQDLGTLGGPFSRAFSVNESDNVVGYSYIGTVAPLRAFLWKDGVITDLGTLGGQNSLAYGINNAGQVVGGADVGKIGNSTIDHAFLYQNGVMNDLGTLPGGASSFARAINDAGQVVGGSGTIGNTSAHAFLYSGGVMKDLDAAIDSALGWTLMDATDINSNGQIVGLGTINGEEHGYLLTPSVAEAPEPSTLALVEVGGLGLLTLRRRPAERHR